MQNLLKNRMINTDPREQKRNTREHAEYYGNYNYTEANNKIKTDMFSPYQRKARNIVIISVISAFTVIALCCYFLFASLNQYYSQKQQQQVQPVQHSQNINNACGESVTHDGTPVSLHQITTTGFTLRGDKVTSTTCGN